MKVYLSIILVLVLCAGCTAQQGFEALKSHEQGRCIRGPEVQYEDCMSRVAMSYDEYQEKFPLADTRRRRGQCATAVYEFAGKLIRNVWYYPAHACDGAVTD